MTEICRKRKELLLSATATGATSIRIRSDCSDQTLPDTRGKFPRISNIKDLRSRRVFSPALISDDGPSLCCNIGGFLDSETNCEGGKKAGIDSSNVRENGGFSEESGSGSHEPSVLINGSITDPLPGGENDKVQGNGAADDLEEECLQSTPPDIEILGTKRALPEYGSCQVASVSAQMRKSVLAPCSRTKLFKNPGSLSYRRLLPYLKDIAKDTSCASLMRLYPKAEKPLDGENGRTDCVQQKFDDNVSLKDRNEDDNESKANGDLDAEEKHILQSADRVLDKSSTEILRGTNTSPVDKKIGSSPKSKLVQEPVSKRKLFRTPGSVNYRRLLPFLMDSVKDPPCAPENGLFPEIEKSLEDKTLSISSVPGSEATAKNFDGNSCTKMPKVTSNTLPDACGNDEPEVLNPELVPESPAPSDSAKEMESRFEHVILDTDNTSEISHEVLLSENGGSDLLRGVISSSDRLSVNTAGECTKLNEETANNEKQAEANWVHNKSPQVEASVSGGTPLVSSSPKGILKRNARGCRGVCNCLNCSSFRLHAERAFEFSRNQMQDTEEVVLDLVGELSYVRDMLEKSASSDHAAFFVNQVKKACQKASEAVELAKDRLQQMNNELQVHCRIPNEQRARVKFACYIQEKIIPRVDEPSE